MLGDDGCMYLGLLSNIGSDFSRPDLSCITRTLYTSCRTSKSCQLIWYLDNIKIRLLNGGL